MTRVDELQTPEDIARLGPEVKSRAGLRRLSHRERRLLRRDGHPADSRPVVRRDATVPDAPHVAVISESLAATKWPDQDPIGRFIQFGNMDGDLRGFRIVGIVSDVREVSPEAVPGPLFYALLPAAHGARASPSSCAPTRRGRWPPTAATSRARELDPELPRADPHGRRSVRSGARRAAASA